MEKKKTKFATGEKIASTGNWFRYIRTSIYRPAKTTRVSATLIPVFRIIFHLIPKALSSCKIYKFNHFSRMNVHYLRIGSSIFLCGLFFSNFKQSCFWIIFSIFPIIVRSPSNWSTREWSDKKMCDYQILLIIQICTVFAL